LTRTSARFKLMILKMNFNFIFNFYSP